MNIQNTCYLCTHLTDINKGRTIHVVGGPKWFCDDCASKLKPIASHRHGKGRFEVEAYGAKEDCDVCNNVLPSWSTEPDPDRLAKEESALNYAAGKAISLGILSFAALMLAVPVLATPEDVERIWAFWKSVF